MDRRSIDREQSAHIMTSPNCQDKLKKKEWKSWMMGSSERPVKSKFFFFSPCVTFSLDWFVWTCWCMWLAECLTLFASCLVSFSHFRAQFIMDWPPIIVLFVYVRIFCMSSMKISLGRYEIWIYLPHVFRVSRPKAPVEVRQVRIAFFHCFIDSTVYVGILVFGHVTLGENT